MGDDKLQREGGNALMNSVSHAVRPGILKMIGAGCICVAVAIVKIVVSPY